MIILDNVSKRYVVDGEPQDWILKDVSLRIPAGVNIGVVGAKNAGKTTLLELISGAETPTTGTVQRTVRVAYPGRYMRNFQKLLTGRQNARFICRVNGYTDDLEQRLAKVEQFARLGPKFDQPASSYSQPHKAQLSFALSWAFDFDVYVADDFRLSGVRAFGSEEIADAELRARSGDASFIFAATGLRAAEPLRQLCTAGIWVHDERADWFDSFEDALRASAGASSEAKVRGGKRRSRAEMSEDDEEANPALAGIRRLQSSLVVLARGVQGHAPVVDRKSLPRILRVAQDAGLELATGEEMSERGLAPFPDAIPILRLDGAEGVEYFDVNTQAFEAEESDAP
jgi:capsular polysaccharide transport system ATP-binding protein